MNALSLLAQQDDLGGAAAGVGLVGMIIYLAIIILLFAGLWKIFSKAGKPGWASIIPIYNIYVLTEIAGKPILWFILSIIPCTAPIGLIIVWIAVAERFGKGAGYGLGLTFLAPIFWPMLGFGSARYLGPAPQ